MKEIWKPIKGYEGIYDISNYGRIYSHPRKGTKGGYSYGIESYYGYLCFNLRNGKRVHKKMHTLVYEAFIGEVPKGYDVHHKDSNKHNNFIWNLELIEHNEHSKHHLEEHKEKTLKACFNKNSKAVIQYTLDGQFLAEYPSVTEASKQNGIGVSNICICCKGKAKTAGGYIWKYKI